MSGQNIFANAPVTQSAPILPSVAPGSNLAAAMSMRNPMNLQAPSTGIPLSSMLALKSALSGGGAINPTPGNNTSSLTQQPDGTWSGDPGAAAPPLPYGTPGQAPMQGPAPGMPSNTGMPGTPVLSGPGTPTGGAPGTPGMGTLGMPSPDQPGAGGQIASWLQSLMANQQTGGTSGASGGM